jgi:hypothetical protein
MAALFQEKLKVIGSLQTDIPSERTISVTLRPTLDKPAEYTPSYRTAADTNTKS